jgi:hypothetical protein
MTSEFTDFMDVFPSMVSIIIQHGTEVVVCFNTLLSEIRCSLVKGVGNDVHERLYKKTELNNYALYRYCTSTAV